ncbi:lipopolysaccharide biosynthesis protein [Thermus scotoductus]|uniref:Lipopolysaccharide biosynthesis protein n=1 Tax=Thermus scotoductus TaxID=37636 RepID=A0A430RH53_THESC|nr:lipopolysaccharide biosynthesis protein [Thermus scotoductus]RTG98249.1 lipopolysaccharide biosynthesis protein [Thermus scotoductus]RTH07576.1 lipopolysaccharide biosynthesis protein [Thermus scotoductus]RTH22950.1 lipopolysaccharide biosynthesis protein [Thermus scotoductus]RTI01361.1 lipopolysaccharide biosynthesis protein [Thermus scotoductus]RTI24846.1 lipopolysaccharide biosynthesis protein [Thermus scotoductus]
MEPKELTLLDLLAPLRQSGPRIALLAVTAGLLVYGASLLLPPRYESQALVRLDLQPPPRVGALVDQDQTQNQNYLSSLALALRTAAPAWRFPDGGEVARLARVEWKDGDQTLRVQATGPTPRVARERASWLVQESQRFLRERVLETYRSLIQAELARGKEALETLRKSLEAEPPKTLFSSTSDPALAPYLEAQGVSPPVARSPNPAATYLALKRAELWAEMARLQAEVEKLEAFLREDGALERFLAVSELVPPTLPESPLSPRPLAYGALAALAVFLLGLLLIFFSALLREEGGQGT